MRDTDRRISLWVLLIAFGMSVILLKGCTADRVCALHLRPSFDGTITVVGDAVSLTGELVFHRKAKNYQFTKRGETTVVLGRDGQGGLFAFEGGRHRSVRADEERELQVILALVDGTELTDTKADADGYWVEARTLGRLRITVEERPPDPHGGR